MLSFAFLVFRKIPVIGSYVEAPFKKAVQFQKEKLHRKPGAGQSSQQASNFFPARRYCVSLGLRILGDRPLLSVTLTYITVILP